MAASNAETFQGIGDQWSRLPASAASEPQPRDGSSKKWREYSPVADFEKRDGCASPAAIGVPNQKVKDSETEEGLDSGLDPYDPREESNGQGGLVSACSMSQIPTTYATKMEMDAPCPGSAAPAFRTERGEKDDARDPKTKVPKRMIRPQGR